VNILPEGVSHSRFPALDGYRGIAAFMIVGTHVAFLTAEIDQGVVGKIFARFDFGVAIFFLLSGFLLYGPFGLAALSGRSRPSSGTFYRRRILRIFPAYLVMCVTVLLVAPPMLREAAPTVTQWIANLTLTQTYVPDAQVASATQTWSLATEVSFYAVLPLIAWLATKRSRGNPERSFRRQLIAMVAVGGLGLTYQILLCFGFLGSVLLAGFWLPAYLDWFALGMLVSLIRNAHLMGVNNRITRIWEATSSEVGACLVIGLSLFAIAATPLSGPYGLEFNPGFNRLAKHVLFGLSALFLLIPGFWGRVEGRWLRFMSSPFMRWLGTVSYGVFLWNLFVAGWTMRLLNVHLFGGWFWVVLPLATIATYAIGWLSWVLIEKRFIAFSHRGFRPRKEDGQGAAGVATDHSELPTSVGAGHIGNQH